MEAGTSTLGLGSCTAVCEPTQQYEVRHISTSKAHIVDENERIVEAVISTAHVDRLGTRIHPRGVQYDNFMRYGTVLFNHRQDFPIGRCLKITATDTELRALWQFANFSHKPAEEWGEIGKKVEDLWYLYKNGYLMSYSIGFLPLQVKGIDILKSELWEFSLVAIPANPFALALDEKAQRCFRAILRGSNPEEPNWKQFAQLFQQAVREEIRSIAQKDVAMMPTNESAIGEYNDNDVVETRAVKVNTKGRSHANALIEANKIDYDSDWEFTAEDGNRLLGPNGDDWEEYSKWFLGIEDNANEETKERYKYPYGKNGKVYRKGVIAAKQRSAQQGHTDVFAVASELLEKIDKKRENREDKRSVRLLPHLAARILGTPLLISDQKLEAILSVLGERLGLDEVPQTLTGFVPKTRNVPASLALAVIPVHGTLVQRSSGINALSQLTSYREIAQSFRAALQDPTVKAILLDIDSPGGEASGVFDLVDEIYKARGVKPVWAFINEMGTSAAYALASAADKVFAPRTALVGSIGVVAVHIDESKRDEKLGLKWTYIHAGEAKTEGNPHEPLSESARTNLQRMVDAVYDLFVKTVARNRGVTPEMVRATQAQTYMASVLGEHTWLIDGIMSEEECLRELEMLVQEAPRRDWTQAFVTKEELDSIASQVHELTQHVHRNTEHLARIARIIHKLHEVNYGTRD